MSRRYDESSPKYEFPGTYPSREAAKAQARYKYDAVKREYGNQIEEDFKTALKEVSFSDGSGYFQVKLTRVVD